MRTGTIVSSQHDPLLARLMYHSQSRYGAIEGMYEALGGGGRIWAAIEAIQRRKVQA